MAGKGHKFLRRGDQVDVFGLCDKDWAVEARLLALTGGARADVYRTVQEAGVAVSAGYVIRRLAAQWGHKTVTARLTELAYPGRYAVPGAGLLLTERRTDGVRVYRPRPFTGRVV